MPLVTFCFHLHEPLGLPVDDETTLWDRKNREAFVARAEKCYLPTTRLFTDLVRGHLDFKISYCLSGTFLEQAGLYYPQVIDGLKALFEAGQHTRQVEFLEQTYYHSLASFFVDPRKTEFKEQVALHRQTMYNVFDVRPATFANTELLYNNEVANIVADMGYKAILCEPCGKMVNARAGTGITPTHVFRAKGRNGRARKLAVLPRSVGLSNELASRLGGNVARASSPGMALPADRSSDERRETRDERGPSASAHDYFRLLRDAQGEQVLVVCDFPLIEAGTAAYSDMVDFWRILQERLSQSTDVVPANPGEVAEWFQITDCPMIDGPCPKCRCDDAGAHGPAMLRSRTQRLLFEHVENLEPKAKRAGGELLRRFRYLTASDHWQYLAGTTVAACHRPDSPYDSTTTATYALTHAADELFHAIKSFTILQRSAQTAVVLITPETDRLPSEGMGQFAKFVSGKSGGLGEVVSALCKGLSERRVPVHLVTINLTRRFREEAGLSEEEWIRTRQHLNPENVHLVSSGIYEGYRSAYEGWPLANAAEFQRQIVNTYIKEIRSKYEGRAILHTNDWMAGGIVAAYGALRGIPILHTVHNTHTGYIPLDMFYGVNLRKLWDLLYVSTDMGRRCVDAQATAIKNATRISYVGEKFLKEVVEDYFLDRWMIPASVRQETKIKYYNRSALVIPNGISPDVFPENQRENADLDQGGLVKRFGPDDNVLEAKRLNLAKFQRRMGLNADLDAILLYWPSRLDPTQKGIELLEQIAQSFVSVNGDVQIAVVADPVGGDNTHAEIMGRIAYASGGKIAYHRFDPELSVLGYAAAGDVFGASLYEPFGQIDVVGNLYGATATNRDTGGYADKITMLSLRAWGAPIDNGNGVLFRNYDTGGLWWGLSKTVENHRYFRRHPKEWEKQMRRIMKEARQTWSLDSMVARYITAYEELNNGKPLV